MSTYTIEDANVDMLYFAISRHDNIQYQGIVIPSAYVRELAENPSAKGISFKRLLDLSKECFEKGILLTPLSARKIAKLEHKGKVGKFISDYKDYGFVKNPGKISEKKKEELSGMFEKKFGRAPQVLPQIAAMCDVFSIPTKNAVEKFSIQNMRSLLSAGISKAEAVLLYTHLNEQQLQRVARDLYVSQMVSTLILKSLKKQDESLLRGALWIANHSDTNKDFLKKVYDKVSELSITESTTIDQIKTQFNNKKAESEVAKIEKAYKKTGFKLKNCVCELRKTQSSTERYSATILEGNDPRQVMLGYDTDCCQHLGEAGESAMMHGLLHPKAGFWVVTKSDSGKVVAQAEAWELNENTLVFDNIEFANDAEIDQYKEIIGKWVRESAYENIIMGCGYNEFGDDSFEYAGAVVPPVTAYELYVLSYEEDCDAREEICCLPSEDRARELMEQGTITYFDYVYCDSERDAVYLKRNNRVAEFFNAERSEYEDDFER